MPRESSLSLDGIAALNGKAVTLSDTVDLPDGPAIVWVCGPSTGATGTSSVKVRTVDGDDLTFYNHPDASPLPVKVERVFLTGTTANVVCIALY